jgi:hypothetical protein
MGLSVGWANQRNRGPWLYMERGGFMLHVVARRFRDPWQDGFGALFTLRLRDRYVIFKRWGVC